MGQFVRDSSGNMSWVEGNDCVYVCVCVFYLIFDEKKKGFFRDSSF